MATTQETITITLPVGSDKTIMFETIAKANWWTATKIETVEKSVTVNSVDAQAKFEELKTTVNGFGFIWAFKETDTTETLKYTENVEVANTPASEVGKNILVAQLLETYAQAKIQIDSELLEKQLAEQKEASLNEVKQIGEIIVE